MSDYLLAIDVGTTSTKCMAVLPDNTIIGSHQKYYLTYYPHPGHAEQDPDVIVKAVVEVVREAKRKTGLSSNPIALCISTAMHALMTADVDGNPMTPLIIWADTRSTLQAKKLRSTSLAQQFYEKSGTPIHPMSPLCKLLWWKEHHPEIILQAHKILSIKDYIIYCLTGEYLIDYSVASATGIFDISGLCWSLEALDLLGIPKEKLSQPVPVTHICKPLREEVAQAMEISQQVPVIIGASDGCLAQSGSNAMNKGDMSITVGTSGAVRMVSHQREIDKKGRVFNYLLHENEFICGGATNNGTALLNWFSAQFDLSSTNKLPEFVQEVSHLPAGSDGLIMLPYLLGERAPMYNPDARGVYFGVSINHNRLHFRKALIEGVCFELKSIVNCLVELYGPPERIMVSGGFTHSAEWIQILCNVIGKELILMSDKDASTLGAAKLGFEVMQIPTQYSVQSEHHFYPDMDIHRLYGKSFMIFEKLYHLLEGEFDHLAQLQNR